MTMRATWSGIFAVTLGAACGPDTVEQAELGEVCGEQGPFRVLELQPDEHLRLNPPLQVGDRVFYVVSRIDPAAPVQGLFPDAEETTVWATGPCGESPARVATGIDRVFTIDAWPDVALGCDDETGDVVSLDPSGAEEPHVVFSGVDHRFGCGLRWTPHGVLSVEPRGEELGALLLHPYPADPRSETSEPVTLLDPVFLRPSGRGGSSIVGRSLHAFDEFVLALTPDEVLVRIDLAAGAVSTVVPAVRQFESSRDGRFMVWQDPTVTMEHDDYPEGKIFLRDLESGTDALLVEAALDYSMFPMQWAERGVVQIGLGYIDRDPKRVFFLPGLEHVDVPAQLFLSAFLGEGRWLASSGDGYDVIDLRSGAATRLSPRGGELVHLDGEAIELIEVPHCCIDGGFADEGPLWRVSLDGSESRQLAKRATRLVRRLDDGRFVGPVGVDAEWLSELVIVDPETQAELRVDDRVFALSLDTQRAAEEGIIRYSVSDGERSGVYLARLPSHTRERSAPSGATEALAFDMLPGRDGRPVPVPRASSELPGRGR